MTGKIQIKRGADSTKLPALAYGELAYVEDVNSLYIGAKNGTNKMLTNGSSVGNKKTPPNVYLVFYRGSEKTPTNFCENEYLPPITHNLESKGSVFTDTIILPPGYVYNFEYFLRFEDANMGSPRECSAYFGDSKQPVVTNSCGPQNHIILTDIPCRTTSRKIRVETFNLYSCFSFIIKGWIL